ncbi:MAG: TonB family protein [Bacteriovoracaceae bacterium]
MDTLQGQRRIFYLLLLAIFILHASMMVVKFRDQLEKVAFTPSQSIKVKLIQEALKEMANNQKRQIVQSEDSAREEKTKDAFLSDKDRAFDRQTVARSVDTFQKAAKGNAASTQVASQSKTAEKKKANFKDIKLSDIGMMSGDPMPKKADRSPASASVKGMENGDPLSKGLSATNDYVEEVALGDFTHLNTVEYKFYGFFHRIRQKLEQFWGKSIQEKAANIFRQGRRLPASENLITSLQVTLNAKGEIIAVKIMGASGVKELDDAAIESFNQAGPFPNPPKDLLVNGKATIEWGFVVKS